MSMDLPAVFVTGGNGGIGAAICKQLVLDHGCRVFLGSRSIERGHNAIKDMGLGDKEGNISVVQCDVQSDDSVKEAAAKVGQFCRICITCKHLYKVTFSCRLRRHWEIRCYMVSSTMQEQESNME